MRHKPYPTYILLFVSCDRPRKDGALVDAGSHHVVLCFMWQTQKRWCACWCRKSSCCSLFHVTDPEKMVRLLMQEVIMLFFVSCDRPRKDGVLVDAGSHHDVLCFMWQTQKRWCACWCDSPLVWSTSRCTTAKTHKSAQMTAAGTEWRTRTPSGLL